MQYLHIIFLLLVLHTSCTQSQNNNTDKTRISQTFVRNMGSEPETLHPIRSTDAYASIIHGHVLDSLLERDTNTYELKPHLAEKWHINKDHTIFTFTIRQDVKWHDGQPLTARDIAFSFEARKNPSFGGYHYLPYFENIESVKVLDKHRVQFKANKKYFNNLSVLGITMEIIPEHIYKDKDKKLGKTLIGSGPYIFKQYLQGKHILLEQNEDWWGRNLKPNQHRIKKIMFRFIKDETSQLMRMAAGDLDFLWLRPETYMKKTNRPPWGESITKKEVSNKQPSGYGYIGWNLKNLLFQNKKTRKALAHLMNRELINEKFHYNKEKLATGPWYSWSDYADQSILPVSFDPEMARQLLKEAGWVDTNKDGVLEQTINGKTTHFRFTLIFPNKEREKFLTIYKEELKKSGIDMSLRLMDWSAFVKLITEKKFEAVTLGWSGGSVDMDPKQIWHSKSAIHKGSNFISYSNPEVDQLIDEGRMETDRKKRIKIFKKVYRLIAEDYPYLFLFNSPSQFYGYNKKVTMEKETHTYDIGIKYWQLTGL